MRSWQQARQWFGLELDNEKSKLKGDRNDVGYDEVDRSYERNSDGVGLKTPGLPIVMISTWN